MAVPPLGAKVIVEAILKSFAGIPYPTEPSKWEDDLSEMLSTGSKRKKRSATVRVKTPIVEDNQLQHIEEQQSLELKIEEQKEKASN